jgi:amidase
MARSVKDVAILFSAMVGADPADSATRDAGKYRQDFAAALAGASLRGVRVAVYRPDMPPLVTAAFERALDTLKAQGAVLVDVQRPKTEGMGDAEFDVLKFELKTDLDKYLASTPPVVKTRTIDDVIAFDTGHADAEMPYFAQEIFDMAAKSKGVDEPTYRAQRDKSLALAKAAIDGMLKQADATILVQPTYGPAWLSDPIYGDQYNGPSSSELPAISGYPNLTVPMGLVRGLPVGLSFIGPAYSDGKLLQAGYVYEQASKARVAPTYAAAADAGPGVDGTR